MTTFLPCMLCGKSTEIGTESWSLDLWRYGPPYKRDTFEYCVSCGNRILADLDKKRAKALRKWERFQ